MAGCFPMTRRAPLFAIDEWSAAIQNPHTLYRFAKLIDNHPGEGSWSLYALRALTFFGLRRRQFFYEPLSDTHTILSVLAFENVKRQLFLPATSNDHVTISFQIFESANTAPAGALTLPRPGELSKGLHCVAVVGWTDDGNALVFRNSWGQGWGDNGYGTVDREYLAVFLYDAWLARNSRRGLTRFTYARYESAATNAERRRVLLLDNSRHRVPVKYAGRRYHIVIYEALSAQDHCPVEVIELRNRSGVRLAWCELFHPRPAPVAPRTSVLKEFFVWPPFRRRGYGTILEAAAEYRSHEWGATRLTALVHHPDVLLQSRRRAIDFATSRGYRWLWRRSARPPLGAVVEKHVDIDRAMSVFTLPRDRFEASTSRASPHGWNSSR